MQIAVSVKRPAASELADLLAAVGWAPPPHDALERSMLAYTSTVSARTSDGRLIGYASVFSDRCLTTMFGEFIGHPDFRRRGIGRALMRLVEESFPEAPVYVKALGDSAAFYWALGFRESTERVTAMFKRPRSGG